MNLGFYLENGKVFDVGTYHFNWDGYLQGKGHCSLFISQSTFGSFITRSSIGNVDVTLKIDKISNTSTPFGQVTGSFSGTLQADNQSVIRKATISGDFSAGFLNH